MSQPVIDEIRKATAVLERIAVCLERFAGIESPQVVTRAPAQAPRGAVPPTRQQGEPVRAPIPRALPAQGEPPPAKMGPRCNAHGPVFVGPVPIRCSEEQGHTSPHHHAGYDWPNEAAEQAADKPATEGASAESAT